MTETRTVLQKLPLVEVTVIERLTGPAGTEAGATGAGAGVWIWAGLVSGGRTSRSAGAVASGGLAVAGVTGAVVVGVVVVLPWSRSETFGVGWVVGVGGAGEVEAVWFVVDAGTAAGEGVWGEEPRDNVMPSARPQKSTPIIMRDMCNGRKVNRCGSALLTITVSLVTRSGRGSLGGFHAAIDDRPRGLAPSVAKGGSPAVPGRVGRDRRKGGALMGRWSPVGDEAREGSSAGRSPARAPIAMDAMSGSRCSASSSRTDGGVAGFAARSFSVTVSSAICRVSAVDATDADIARARQTSGQGSSPGLASVRATDGGRSERAATPIRTNSSSS